MRVLFSQNRQDGCSSKSVMGIYTVYVRGGVDGVIHRLTVKVEGGFFFSVARDMTKKIKMAKKIAQKKK